MINRFNVRVYFILMNETGNAILVSDEIIHQKHYTKFPGGGLEYGEGIAECVLREAQEELKQEVTIIRHLYTTDFFVQSAFKKEDQVISVYYLVEMNGEQQFKTSEKKFDFTQVENDEESFRWVNLEDLHPDDFNFPADQEMVRILLDSY